MKIKVNIPEFGERYCSNNVEYKLYNRGNCYVFLKKGTRIYNNEYGPAVESKDGNYIYYINNKLHKLNLYAFYSNYKTIKHYYVIGKYLGKNEEFIKYLANVLIPK